MASINPANSSEILQDIEPIRSLAQCGSLLTREQVDKLGKKEVIDYLFKRDTLSAALTSLAGAFDKLSKRLETSEAKVAVLTSSNQQLNEKCSSLEKRLIAVERSATNSAQYLRRRQIEIKNIPQQSNGPALKQTISSLLSLTGETVTPADLDKCHTLGKGVIMEFKTREKRDAVLRGRKNFKSKNNELKSMKMEKPMVLESLCKQYSELDYICRKLHKSKSIEQTWFFNGRLHVEVEQGDKRQISHLADLHDIFGVDVISRILDSN